MKKKSFIFLGLLCTLAFYSCTKNVVADSDQLKSGDVSAMKSAPVLAADIFDPSGLVSASAHGQLSVLGSGFSFTEGPAVDKHGNIFFTDQPNDKIYKWAANTGQISTFLSGTGR